MGQGRAQLRGGGNRFARRRLGKWRRVLRARSSMPLILILRFLFSLLSLAIIAAAAYFLWRWYDGVAVQDTAGVVHLIREDWHLWVGLGALVWSFAGGFVLRPILAGPDSRVLKAVQGSAADCYQPDWRKAPRRDVRGPERAAANSHSRLGPRPNDMGIRRRRFGDQVSRDYLGSSRCRSFERQDRPRELRRRPLRCHCTRRWSKRRSLWATASAG